MQSTLYARANYEHFKTKNVIVLLSQKDAILPPETFPWDILWKVSKQRINLNLNAHPIQKTYIPIHNLLSLKCQPHRFLFSPKRVILPYFTPETSFREVVK